MAYKLSFPAPDEPMRTYYTKGSQLLPFFEKEIYIEDNRSAAMPELIIGLVIGITLDKVLIRSNNNMTIWYQLRNDKIKIFL